MKTLPLLILFDGYCNLCDRSVNLIIRNDPTHHFRFVALQSEAGIYIKKHLKIPPETDSVILVENGLLYFQSEAFLRIAKRMRFPWNLAVAGWIVPGFLRDRIYMWIARNRHKWFGKRDFCRIPGKAERELFPSVDELQSIFSS